MKFLATFTTALLLPVLALAAPYDRPIPQPQSSTAEFWFFLASLTLIGALFCVAMVIKKR